jgi:hypothetical protein
MNKNQWKIFYGAMRKLHHKSITDFHRQSDPNNVFKVAIVKLYRMDGLMARMARGYSGNKDSAPDLYAPFANVIGYNAPNGVSPNLYAYKYAMKSYPLNPYWSN